MNPRLARFALVLVVLPVATASAQTTHVDQVRTAETSSGEIYPDGSTRVGHSFGGTARGSLPGAVTFALDYQPGNGGPNVVHTLIGGTWNLSLRDGTLLFGGITGGTISWDAAGARAVVSITVDESTGGFGVFAGQMSSGAGPQMRGTFTLTL
jgi:hypothetical protein